MNNEFIPYRQAISLQELNFNEPCMMVYYQPDNDREQLIYYLEFETIGGYYIKAPLYQQAFRWFREKYNLHSLIEPVLIEDNDQIMYDYMVLEKDGMKEEYNNIPYSSYDEAEIACLDKLIEIVKSK